MAPTMSKIQHHPRLGCKCLPGLGQLQFGEDREVNRPSGPRLWQAVTLASVALSMLSKEKQPEYGVTDDVNNGNGELAAMGCSGSKKKVKTAEKHLPDPQLQPRQLPPHQLKPTGESPLLPRVVPNQVNLVERVIQYFSICVFQEGIDFEEKEIKAVKRNKCNFTAVFFLVPDS